MFRFGPPGARWLTVLGLVAVVAGCDGGSASPPPDGPTAKPAPKVAAKPAPPVAPKPSQPVEVPDVPTRYEAVPKMAAIGDMHGDLDAARRALRLAGAIDENDTWVGGKLVVVQTGDQLDRGDQELEILDLLDSVSAAAKEAGGALHVLNGNHEYMNAMGDFRYVTPGGFAEFASETSSTVELSRFPEKARGRAAAFLPGGTQATRLAHRNAVIIVGDTVFAHGGVLPKYARRIDEVNEVSRKWLAGALEDPQPAIAILMDPQGVVWTRAYSDGTPSDDLCQQLDEALRSLSASRMVVGHTVQKSGITPACNDKIWRIDTGMAQVYGGRPAALVIEDGKAHPVYE
jgi:hypothetical protein